MILITMALNSGELAIYVYKLHHPQEYSENHRPIFSFSHAFSSLVCFLIFMFRIRVTVFCLWILMISVCVGRVCEGQKMTLQSQLHLCLLVYLQQSYTECTSSRGWTGVERLLLKAPLAAEPSLPPVNTFKKALWEILKVNLFMLFWVYFML